MQKPKIKSFCDGVLYIVVLFIAIVVVFNATLYFARTNDRIASVTCPCGSTRIVSYKYCSECGASALDGTYTTYPHCEDCGTYAVHDVYCSYCGSENVEEPKRGNVRDLPLLSRLRYQ